MQGLARRAFLAGAVILGSVSLTGCGDDSGIAPGALRFGQRGEVTARLETPLRLGEGILTQTLTWQSNGMWSLREAISYNGVTGDETLRQSEGDPSIFAADYAVLITAVNEVAELELDIGDLPPGLTAECGATRTTLTLSIEDTFRGETRTWTQCADGSLTEIVEAGAGPVPAAARLVAATLQARNLTFGPDSLSAYHGSVPFATIDRGEDSPAAPGTPRVITNTTSWRAFWLAHSGASDAPSVNFDEQMVVIGAVGVRGEAGDSVEVRRILQVDEGTLVEVFERVPGDFCSPAARSQVPYHIVVAPKTPPPVLFSDVRVELVPCR